MNQLIQQIEKEHLSIIQKENNNKAKNFNVGDDVIVSVTIPASTEKGARNQNNRVQNITGRCIGIRNKSSSAATFKLLKLDGTKVIMVFSLYSPLISVTVKTAGYARRAKLNYLIARTGKALRIRTKKVIKIKKTITAVNNNKENTKNVSI